MQRLPRPVPCTPFAEASRRRDAEPSPRTHESLRYMEEEEEGGARAPESAPRRLDADRSSTLRAPAARSVMGAEVETDEDAGAPDARFANTISGAKRDALFADATLHI